MDRIRRIGILGLWLVALVLTVAYVVALAGG